mmetsp:Transcript_15504/g.26211  ORF Transcript_15504/g.26211 Transcript_15504/m.26211 type:complete len:108 (+) Transcript_15504:216-539(+)
MQKSLGEIDTLLIKWGQQLESQEELIKDFSNGVIQSRAIQSETILDKLNGTVELMAKAEKKEESLKKKQQKIIGDKNPEKWENPKLLTVFGVEEVKKVINSNKTKCL